MLKHRTLLITGTNKNTGKVESLITIKQFPKDANIDAVYDQIADCIKTNSWFVSKSGASSFVEMFDPKEYSALSLSIQEV